MNIEKNNYRPDMRFRRLSDIKVEDIASLGVKAVGLDIDHTVCYDFTLIYIYHAGKWLKSLYKTGMPIVFVTNSGIIRAALLSVRFKAKFVAFAKKPRVVAFKKASQKLGVETLDMVFIGDRLLTDICGANAAGAKSIYVQPPCSDLLYFKNRKKRIYERKLLEDMYNDV